MYLVFDIGGTFTRGYLVDPRSGKVVDQKQTYTIRGTHKADQSLAEIASGFTHAQPIENICVGFPAPVKGYSDVLSTPYFDGPMVTADIAAALKSACPAAQIVFANDVTLNAFHYVATSQGNFAAINLGTSIGMKVFMKGIPVTGEHFRGGEIGHLRTNFTRYSKKCGCGELGHLGPESASHQLLNLASEQNFFTLDGDLTFFENFDRFAQIYSRGDKALQCATSHMMGRGFAKAYNISYSSPEGEDVFPITGSWGMSTRILGAIVMTHADEKGLSLPPAIAPIQAVMMTVFNNRDRGAAFENGLRNMKLALSQSGVRFEIDDSEARPGQKHYHWEKQGVPVRIVYGPQEMATDSVTIVRRDTGEKLTFAEANLPTALPSLIQQIQEDMFDRAKTRLVENIAPASCLTEFESLVASTPNAFIAAGWCGTPEAETRLKKEYGYTVRCIPFAATTAFRKCFLTGSTAKVQVLIAKSY